MRQSLIGVYALFATSTHAATVPSSASSFLMLSGITPASMRLTGNVFAVVPGASLVVEGAGSAELNLPIVTSGVGPFPADNVFTPTWTGFGAYADGAYTSGGIDTPASVSMIAATRTTGSGARTTTAWTAFGPRFTVGAEGAIVLAEIDVMVRQILSGTGEASLFIEGGFFDASLNRTPVTFTGPCDLQSVLTNSSEYVCSGTHFATATLSAGEYSFNLFASAVARSVGAPLDTPAPAAAALFGLGAIGLGLRRRVMR